MTLRHRILFFIAILRGRVARKSNTPFYISSDDKKVDPLTSIQRRKEELTQELDKVINPDDMKYLNQEYLKLDEQERNLSKFLNGK